MSEVRINADLPAVVPDAISYETGATRVQAADPLLYVYDHHGEHYGWADPGALSCLFEDMMQGRPMPPTFATKGIRDIDTLVAIALFKRPQLVLVPAAYNLVVATDLAHRRGIIGLAHIDPDLSRFFGFLREQFSKRPPKKELDALLDTTAEYIEDYVCNGRLPQLGGEPKPPVIVNTGTEGFVVAETRGSLSDGWEHLFRNGFRRGILVGKPVSDRRPALIARKGPYVRFRLDLAAKLLNEMEAAMGEPPDWKTDGLWLFGPPDGTLILVSHLIEVLIRV